ncbi:MAG: hypothetical protein IJC99_01660 [Clostridia bacterium]|nr:hypothetical protein [Clostridia bacterium]
MIYKKIETTTDEVLEFIKEAGIEIESTPSSKAFQIRFPDDSIIEMPPDLNIFGDMSLFTATGIYSYKISIVENNDNHYALGNMNREYDNYVDPLKYIPAA